MEGSNFVASDYKTRVARIAASGNKPEDWKEYIDIIKTRAQTFDDFKKNRIISYVYFNAFKVIPDTDKSLSHAMLLIDYAEFKSHQDPVDAERLLLYGRKNLGQFAIIHVANAEFELKRGNKEKALKILLRAASLGAEPRSIISSAVVRLNEGKTQLLVDTAQESDTDHALSFSSGSNSSGEYSSSQISGTFGEGLSQTLPTHKSNTQEVQQDLNILTKQHFPAATALTPLTESASSTHHNPTDQQKTGYRFNSGLSYHMKTPEPPKLLLRKYSELTKDGVHQENTARNSVPPCSSLQFHVPETPKNYRLEPDIGDGGSTRKASLLLCTPDVRPTFGSAVKDSVSKFQPLNLGPPRRVKLDPALRKLRDEEEVTDSQEIFTSELLQPRLRHAGDKEPSLNPVTSSSEQRYGGPLSGTLQDIPNSKNTDEMRPLSSSALPQLSQFSAKISSLTFTSGRPLPLGLNQQENLSSSSSHHPDQAKLSARNHFTDLSNTSESASSRTIQAALQGDHSKKNSQTSEQMDSLPMPVPQIVDASRLSDSVQSLQVKVADQQMRVKNWGDISAKQQEMIQQQQQIVQQLVQQQQMQQQADGGMKMCNIPSSVPEQQSATTTQGSVIPTRPPIMAGQKTILVNGKPYSVMRQVGRGGSAKVFQVYNPETNTVLALKCVNLSFANQVIVEGYKNEINLLKKLQHCDWVIRLYDFEYVESSKKLLAVLEYGETDLCKFISQNENNQQRLHPITVCYFWFQMVTAVHAMHKEGVIHSDLKPANFILVSGQVKLIDFGIANSLQQDSTSVLKENMVGTPSYMSPEALMAVNSDPTCPRPRYKIGVRSDVWSLGCILYQMVYGHTPFQQVRQKLEAIVNPAHEIPFPDKGDPILMDVLKKCLTREVQKRPSSEELLNHPYLHKHSEGQVTAPSIDSRLRLLESALYGASPRSQLAVRKRFMELVPGVDGN